MLKSRGLVVVKKLLDIELVKNSKKVIIFLRALQMLFIQLLRNSFNDLGDNVHP
jgi:hypothetical protein